MTNDIIRKYTPEQTARKRDEYINDIVLPVIRTKFDQIKEFQHAVLFVAQYWNDEARDAVQHQLAFSIMDQPNIESYMAMVTRSYLAEYDEDEMWATVDFNGKAESFELDVLLEGRTAFNFLLEKYGRDLIEPLHWENNYCKGWSSNHTAIPLFAAYCKEGGDQDSEFSKNYNPIIIFRRASNTNEIDYDYIGEMKRPWLDGVMPYAEAENERKS